MFTYYSVFCDNYGALFSVLMHHQVPFEWHSKLRSGKCYADFYLDNERNPSLEDIKAEAKEINIRAGRRGFNLIVISKYIV